METCQQFPDISVVNSTAGVEPIKPTSSLSRVGDQLSSSMERNLHADTNVEVGYLKNIFKNLPLAIIMLDSHGLVQYQNNTAINFFGEPLMGERWSGVIERCFQGHSQGEELKLKSGRLLKLEISPLDSKSGQVLIFNDVTKDSDLKRIRDHYSRLVAMGEMAASLAHQIRTPLAASLLFFSNIRKFLPKKSAACLSLEKGISGLKHIEIIIKDMLLFSKSEKNTLDKLYVIDLVNDLRRHTNVLIKDYEYDIKITDETDNKELYLNRHTIKSVISNIIENALQACKEKKAEIINNSLDEIYKPEVRICLRRHSNKTTDTSIDIIIEDNGIGICSDNITRVIDPFYTTKNKGTGLGLSIAKTVIDAHDGKMSIVSSPMKGTVVTVSLP